MTTISIIKQLEALLLNKRAEINEWFMEQDGLYPPLLYSSVDLRNSGHKLAPVDTNIFPAGFNNLSNASKTRAAERFKDYILKIAPNAEQVLLFAENHTRNLNYLDNLVTLTEILAEAGFKSEIASLASENREVLTLTSQLGRTVLIHHPEIIAGVLKLENGFTPDVIVLNNDLSTGVPEVIANAAQPTMPPIAMGWFRRRKSHHAYYYDKICAEFGEKFATDPWLISCIGSNIENLNFKEKSGFEKLAIEVDALISRIRLKYQEHGISDEPYVFIKADSGTYGMGIMTAKSGEEVLAMNKDARKKMNVIKEGVVNTEVIIQEGVHTIDRIDGSVAEPVIYLVGGRAIGGAYRVNNQRDEFGNLNSAGMTFSRICDDEYKASLNPENVECNFCVFDLISRLSVLAAAMEAEAQIAQPKAAQNLYHKQ